MFQKSFIFGIIYIVYDKVKQKVRVLKFVCAKGLIK